MQNKKNFNDILIQNLKLKWKLILNINFLYIEFLKYLDKCINLFFT